MTEKQVGSDNDEAKSSRRLPQPRARYSLEHGVLLALLIEARKTAGLSQAALAQRLNKVQSHVAFIESGERDLTAVEAYRWCEQTNISFEEFAHKLDQGIRAKRMQTLPE